MNEKVTIRCVKHDFIFKVTANKHLHAAQGCPKCSKKYRRNTAEFIAEAMAIHHDDYNYSKTVFNGVDKPVILICNRCNLEFSQIAYSHLQNKGCVCCSESKGERAIRYFLDDNHIDYVREKRFKDCVYKSTLPFDFCLPNHQILIEFDGAQHYEAGHFFGGEAELLEVQKRDQIKTQWAKVNHWRLIRIRYDEDVHARLESIFLDLN